MPTSWICFNKRVGVYILSVFDFIAQVLKFSLFSGKLIFLSSFIPSVILHTYTFQTFNYGMWFKICET